MNNESENFVPLIKLANGKEFVAEDNETILQAATRAGIMLEHSCKTGRCGACKAFVTRGLSVVIGSESALPRKDIDEGMILTCVRAAATELQLAIEDLGDFAVFPPKTLPCRIQSLRLLSPEVLQVTLRIPPNQQLDFHPGQYFDLIGKDALRRSYSIASKPGCTKPIELHIRRVDGGAMSNYMFLEAKCNDLLRLNGPLGTFFMRDVAGLDLIFLATGTGIAPIKAILEDMCDWDCVRLPRSIRIYWGGRKPEDLYWNPTELGLSLTYIPVLSRGDQDWAGVRGYVQDAILDSDFAADSSVVYACGSVNMIEDARAKLIAAGLHPQKFFSDAFVASAQT